MDRLYVCWIELTKISYLFAKLKPGPKIGIVYSCMCVVRSISKVILVPARPKLYHRAFYYNTKSNRKANYF